jgi:hypothetical protein
MQVQSDPFLGWTHIGGRDYLVRQLNDHKGSIDLEDLAGGGLEAYAEVCGELLARGHARSGDPLVMAGYIGSGDGFAEALAKFGSDLCRPDGKGLDQHLHLCALQERLSPFAATPGVRQLGQRIGRHGMGAVRLSAISNRIVRREKETRAYACGMWMSLLR